jgi:tetratricopeptide (TPR) repeat protein/transglutaminase-like putative cysteine protease
MSRHLQFLFWLLALCMTISLAAIAQSSAESPQPATASQKPEAKTNAAPARIPGQSKNQPQGSPLPAGQKPPLTLSKESDYSKEGVIVERLITKVAFEADGTGTRETSVVMRVQSQSGVQSLAVPIFPYLSSNENVEFDYIRVRKPDGSVVATPDYNVQDMPADVTRIAPMYSDIHEKHVTVKALGVGDVLEYVVRYRTFKPQVPGQFWYEYTFGKDSIAKDHELQITIPRDKYVKIVSPGYKPEIKDDAAHRTYLWKTANLKREDEDASQPRREAPRPDVQITTFRNWDEVGRWYDELQRPQLALTPQLRAKAAELTKGLNSDEDKLRAIYDFVSTRFHYVSLSFGVGRYQPHPAEDVLENEYGDCKDKHTLLAALLNAAGIEAWPAAINSLRKIDPDVPSPGQFNHVITYVPRGDKPLWLDTTPEIAPFGLLMPNLRNKRALVIASGKPAELKSTPANPPFPSSQSFSIEGKLNGEGTFTAHVQQTAHGDAEVLYRYAFRQVPPAQWKDLAQRISSVQGFGGDVSNVNATPPDDTRKPFEFSYDYTRKEIGDWADHRMIAPFPPIGIEGAAKQEKKPPDPVLLGALGEVVYTAKIELPSGFSPTLPSDINLTEPYADFHSEYRRKDNIVTVVRRLTVKQNEVALDQWEKYKKFSKAISDDWGAWIELNTGRQNTSKRNSDSPLAAVDPEILDSAERAWDALQRNDSTTAEEIIRGLLETHPNSRGLHALMGFISAHRGEMDKAIEQFRKEEELHPEETIMYRALSGLYLFQRQDEKAEEQFRKWLALDPKNYDAMQRLSQILYRAKKYAECVELWEKAYEQSPDSSNIRFSLAFAYVDSKQVDKALPLLEKTLTSDSKPMTFNNVAYAIAEQNVHLDKAKEWGDKALQGLEAESLKTDSEEAALTNTRFLGMTWDTVGWIYFRRGELDKAESYLRAAFALSQSSVVGDHLGQVYQKQGKKRQAVHTYKLASAAPDPHPSTEILDHYRQLMEKNATMDFSVKRNPDGSWTPTPSEELNRSRTYKIYTAAHDKGSATFSVVLSPGKIEDVKFVSGNEKLKPIASSIASSKLRAEFPNSDPVRITRRGILMCGSLGCDFTLLLPDSVHATE